MAGLKHSVYLCDVLCPGCSQQQFQAAKNTVVDPDNSYLHDLLL